MDKQIHELLNKHYENGITLITPTGDRSFALRRTEQYIERQTYSGNLQWIIVDDGNEVFSPRLSSIQYIKLKYPGDKVRSFIKNVSTALKHIKYNKVLIIEDDDWYDRKYLALYASRLENYELVGEQVRYYNVKHKCYRIFNNTKHSSFCQTGLQAKLLPNLYQALLTQNPFIDRRLWAKKCKKFIWEDIAHCVGIKGLPGRNGIGVGHRPGNLFKQDNNFEELERWIGTEDSLWYKGIYK